MFANVDFVSEWNTIWGAVGSALGPINGLLSLVGAILVVAAVVKWVWEKRKGSANHGPLLHTIIIGAVLMAPNVVIPIFLTLIDAIVNAAISAGSSIGL